jgi:hypothetical protein
MRRSEFLRQQITGFPNFANQNFNHQTFQKLEFQKNLTRISGIGSGIRILPPMGVPEIGTKNWNSQQSYKWDTKN